MKKIALFILTSLLPVYMLAAETSAFRLTVQMEKLWRADCYLEAMDTAARVLSMDNDNVAAKAFVHDKWDATLRYATKTLETNSDELSLEQSLARLEVYRLMAEISDYLSDVRMPLKGSNWEWYPELYYNQGDYDSERIHVFRLLMDAAQQCVKSYDAEGAQGYYLKALRYLLPGTEWEGNLRKITGQLTSTVRTLGASRYIPDAIFAYELCQTTLVLDTTLAEMREQLPILQQHVSELYLVRAEELEAAGDTIKAADYRAYALDWGVVTEPDPER